MKTILLSFLITSITGNTCSGQQPDDSINKSKIPYGDNISAGKYYNIRGFKMYYEQYGNGEPLLLIHANDGTIRNFVNQIPYFSEKYKVIVADSRAQGKSKDNHHDTLSYEMMADDYAALLSSLKIDSAYVIGWSDGGIIGLLLAIHHPEKVKKLAITGASLWLDPTAFYPVVLNMRPVYKALVFINERTGLWKTLTKISRILFENPHIPLNDLHRIQSPALVIGGDHDIIKPEHTLLIYKNIPKAYLWIVPNSGHSTLVSHKAEFNKTVDAFFSEPYRKIEKLARLQ